MAEVTAPRPLAGPIVYGGLFALVLPALLVLWAWASEEAVNLPALHWPAVGSVLAAAGIALILAGWVALWFRGGGLPMNALPPQRFVASGVYGLVAHPIYVGFSLACLGCAIASGSRSGLWLVSPLTALACAALVLGYEAHDLRARFGADRPAPAISLPPDSPAAAEARDRASAALLVAVPWLALYGAAMLIGPAKDALSTFLPFEARIPVIEQAELVYASTYPLAFLALLAPRTRAHARKLVVRGALANALVFPLYFALPFVAPPKPLVPHGPLGWLLLQERAWDTPAGAFPSFHVLWALLAAEAWSDRWPLLRAPLRVWAWLIAASCILTGMHSLLDVIAGAAAFALVMRAGRVWDALRGLAERAANSWHEWRIGPVRILGYGFWAGLGVLVALSMVSAMIGPGHIVLVLGTAAGGLLGSLLWAQLVERPAAQMRPYGFYGGLLGIIAASLAVRSSATCRSRAWPRRASQACRCIPRRCIPSSGIARSRWPWCGSGRCTSRHTSLAGCTSRCRAWAGSWRSRTVASRRLPSWRGCASINGSLWRRWQQAPSSPPSAAARRSHLRTWTRLRWRRRPGSRSSRGSRWALTSQPRRSASHASARHSNLRPGLRILSTAKVWGSAFVNQKSLLQNGCV